MNRWVTSSNSMKKFFNSYCAAKHRKQEHLVGVIVQIDFLSDATQSFFFQIVFRLLVPEGSIQQYLHEIQEGSSSTLHCWLSMIYSPACGLPTVAFWNCLVIAQPLYKRSLGQDKKNLRVLTDHNIFWVLFKEPPLKLLKFIGINTQGFG